MAFLDNSGDIILDAVLTDAGRQRLARGQFKIVKFALGDEEINYELYNASHTQGSAFYDLEIMQTPVLEAFTNNTSLMKSKLITINENNILYMPTFKLNDGGAAGVTKTHTAATHSNKPTPSFEGYILTADNKTTTNDNNANRGNPCAGVLFGDGGYLGNGTTHGIAVDQGIDVDSASTGLSIADPFPANLLETAYLVRVDDRMLRLNTFDGSAEPNTVMTELRPQFVDDDRIATYFFALGDSTRAGGRGMVREPESLRDRDKAYDGSDLEKAARSERFTGPLGSVLVMYPTTAPSVRNSASLFDRMGTPRASYSLFFGNSASNIGSCKFIDTTINVVGVTTGQSIDIPIRIVKKI